MLTTRSAAGRGAARHRGRGRSVLFSRRTLDRVFCRWPAEEDRRDRRRGPDAGACARHPRRRMERGRHDRVLARQDVGHAPAACLAVRWESRTARRRSPTGRSSRCGRNSCPAEKECSIRAAASPAPTTTRTSWCSHYREGRRRSSIAAAITAGICQAGISSTSTMERSSPRRSISSGSK